MTWKPLHTARSLWLRFLDGPGWLRESHGLGFVFRHYRSPSLKLLFWAMAWYERLFTHHHVLAAVHSGQVDGARPVTGGTYRARLAEEIAQVALEVNAHLAHRGCLLSTGSGSCRSQVTAGGEAARSNKPRVEMVFLSLTTHEADDGTDVVDLCRPLRVHA